MSKLTVEQAEQLFDKILFEISYAFNSMTLLEKIKQIIGSFTETETEVAHKSENDIWPNTFGLVEFPESPKDDQNKG